MLPANLKNTVLRKRRRSRHLKRKLQFFYTPQDVYNKSLWSNFIEKISRLDNLLSSKETPNFQSTIQWRYL